MSRTDSSGQDGLRADRCPNDGQSLGWHQAVGGTTADDKPRTNGEFIGCAFGVTSTPTVADERGITFPDHHLVGPDLGFTCTNCGGHTSLTAPCIPARTYPAAPTEETAEVADEDRHELRPFARCSCGAEHDRRGTGESGYDWHARHLVALTANAKAEVDDLRARLAKVEALGNVGGVPDGNNRHTSPMADALFNVWACMDEFVGDYEAGEQLAHAAMTTIRAALASPNAEEEGR